MKWGVLLICYETLTLSLYLTRTHFLSLSRSFSLYICSENWSFFPDHICDVIQQVPGASELMAWGMHVCVAISALPCFDFESKTHFPKLNWYFLLSMQRIICVMHTPWHLCPGLPSQSLIRLEWICMIMENVRRKSCVWVGCLSNTS